MEGIDKVQILSDEVKILKNEIKDILVEIKEMLITLPQNLAASYSLDEAGGPKNEIPAPRFHQSVREPSNLDHASTQNSAAPAPPVQMPQMQMPQMQMPQMQMPQTQMPQTQMQTGAYDASEAIERRMDALERQERKLEDRKAENEEEFERRERKLKNREAEDDEEFERRERKSRNRKEEVDEESDGRERKSRDKKEESPEKHWIDDEEEMGLEEIPGRDKDGDGDRGRDRDREEPKLREESEETGKAAPKEKKKEMLKKEIEKKTETERDTQRETERSEQSAIPVSPAGDVDIVTLATFSRWLNSGMSRLGKERMQEIIEVSAAMGGISSTMKDILLRLLLMDNGQGYVVKESLAVLIDLENILTRNKKSKDEAAVLSLFINERDGVHG